MHTVGIIAEYNPFHNGPLYQIQKVKELFPNSIIVVVMGGNFSQRGEPTIVSKWERTKMALENGIDLVVELPFVFATQSADIFAHGAIAILKQLQIIDFSSLGEGIILMIRIQTEKNYAK